MAGGVLPAFLISALAGMSTSIGGGIACFSKRSNERFLSASLGFSAGVMLLVSFGELLPDARQSLLPSCGARGTPLAVALSLLLGAGVALLIDRLIPDRDDLHPAVAAPAKSGSPVLVRVGMVTAVAVTVHNLPEGIATFMAGYADLRLGLPVALAIALHNIPEGIAVAVPIYFGTGSRGRALLYSTLSGLSEPVGALLAFLLLAPILSPPVLGTVFGAVAGIMITISFASLIPSSWQYGHTAAAVAGLFAGLLFMKLAMTIFGI